ncbi:MAG TPA: hypothetical protein VK173_03075 [Lacibacter sp.]|nr:hypothetical protein [Lacibacter sp.]
MPTIYVSVNGNSTNLRLRDSEGNNPGNDQLTTTVNPNDTVIWEVDPTPPPGANAIYCIDNVYKKPNNDPNNITLLTGNPSNQGNGVFQATVVATSPGSGKQESYNIDYQITAGSSVLTDDPKLQMN